MMLAIIPPPGLSMWLSSTAQNALQAVLYLADHGGSVPVNVADVAVALGVPKNYLSKTMHILAREGVLLSTRGPRGGFTLAEPPARLVLARVVRPFVATSARRCLVGRATCNEASPCAAHHQWSRVAASVEAFFGHTTIADLLRSAPSPQPT